jgi:phosphatidylglycerol:prolipoprotein diacylglycerol transferase
MIPYFPQPSLDIGPLTIHAFGVLVAGALFLGLTIAARRFRQVGLDRAVAERLVWWAVISGAVCAHLFALIFYHPAKIAENPLVLVQLWGDISSFGSMLGGLIGTFLFFLVRARATTLATRLAYVDVTVYVFSISLMIGRIGCALAHDHPGRVTSFPLAVSLATADARLYIEQVYAAAGRAAELPAPDVLAGLGFHDLGLTELVYLAAVVVPVMLLLGRRARGPGTFLAAFLLLYMPVRFGLDFLRVADARYAGLTPAQWVALAAPVAALPLIRYARRHPGAWLPDQPADLPVVSATPLPTPPEERTG